MVEEGAVNCGKCGGGTCKLGEFGGGDAVGLGGGNVSGTDGDGEGLGTVASQQFAEQLVVGKLMNWREPGLYPGEQQSLCPETTFPVGNPLGHERELDQ